LDVSIVTALEKLLELEHVCLNDVMLLRILDALGFRLSKEHLFAQLSVVGQFHSATKVAPFYVVQYLDPAVEKLFEPHVSWLGFQTQPSNHLVSKVGALGDGFEVIPNAVLEVLLASLRAFILRSTKIPLRDSSALEAVAEQVELLVHVLRVILVILFPADKKFLLV
jgi:hypothetical protein